MQRGAGQDKDGADDARFILPVSAHYLRMPANAGFLFVARVTRDLSNGVSSVFMTSLAARFSVDMIYRIAYLGNQRRETLFTSISVKQLLRSTGRSYGSVTSQALVYEALEIMADKSAGALLIPENGKLAGIFSERDYDRNVILKGNSSYNTIVGELMTSPPICIESETSIKE